MPTASEVAQEFEDVEDTTVSSDDDNTDESEEDGSETQEAEDESTEENSDDDAATSDNEEGYLADDDDDEIAPGAPPTTTPELPAVPSNFTAEEKYIVDNLPLISVRVVMADDSIKTMEVRSAADLPRDMKGIATPYEDKQFDLANAAQESRARELQNYYRNNQSRVQAQDFENKENQAIREDVADLQRAGDIPRFKAQPGTKAFDADPAAKVVQDTIEFMNDRNAKYLEKSNKGGAYRHIGFAEAFELMNGTSNKTSKNSSARKDAAKRLTTGQGTKADKFAKGPTAGRTIKEVAAEFDDFENGE